MALRVAAIVINLAKRKDRLAKFNAYYGVSDLAQHAPLFHQLAVEGSGVSLEKNLTPVAQREVADLVKTGTRQHHSQLSRGAVGCYLSHLQAWQWISKQGATYDAVIVFEDDAVVPTRMWHDLTTLFGNAKDRVPLPWLLLLTAICLRDCSTPGPSGFFEPDLFWSTGAYVMSPANASAILGLPGWLPMDVQIDAQLSRLVQRRQLRVLFAPLVRMAAEDTDIQMPIAAGAPYLREFGSAVGLGSASRAPKSTDATCAIL